MIPCVQEWVQKNPSLGIKVILLFSRPWFSRLEKIFDLFLEVFKKLNRWWCSSHQRGTSKHFSCFCVSLSFSLTLSFFLSHSLAHTHAHMHTPIHTHSLPLSLFSISITHSKLLTLIRPPCWKKITKTNFEQKPKKSFWQCKKIFFEKVLL